MSTVMILGILCGLGAALFQAASYIVSRHILLTSSCSSLQLLAVSQIWLALFAVPALYFTWQPPQGSVSDLAIGLSLSTAGYVAAQAFFFWTVQRVPASRIAPLLGLKIVFVAVLASIFGLETLGAWKWVAVGLAVCAALVINWAGPTLSTVSLLGICTTALCFGISDIGVKWTQIAIHPEPGLKSAIQTLGMCYILMLPLGLCCLPFCGGIRQPWLKILPYAAVWVLAMASLFSAFALCGLVLAIIFQSLRGPLSLVVAAIVAKCGMHHIEVPQDRREWLKQLAAAMLMVGAIAVYVLV